MKHKLIIEQFGKIEKAEIELAPFMLLVGDNNSGKSYLLSLIWGILSAGNESVIWKGMESLQLESYLEVRNKLCGLLEELEKDEEENTEGKIQIPSEKCVEILNALLEQNKDRFVAGIFNSDQMSIQKLEISVKEEFEILIKEKKRGRQRHFFVNHEIGALIFLGETKKAAQRADTLLKHILLGFLKGGKDPYNSRKNVVYLPAARTGFMLSKNVINRVGRQMAYDRIEFYGIEREEEIQPFTKPIISFLDALEEGKLLIRLVNSGIAMIAATHSDIIIQHINNMCRLKILGVPRQLMEKLELSEQDVIDLDKIAVYQFTDQGEYSKVQKVIPEDGEFQVETFSSALMQILEQTSEVQDFEPGQISF